MTWLQPSPEGRIEPGQVMEALRPDNGARHADAREQRDRRPDRYRRDRGALQRARRATARRCRAERGQGPDRCRGFRRRAAQLLRAQARRSEGRRCAVPAPPPAAGAAAAAVRRRSRARAALGHARVCTSSRDSARACAIAGATMAEDDARIRALRERLWLALAGAAPLWRNGAPEPSVPGILSVGFAGIEGESLVARNRRADRRVERFRLQLRDRRAVLCVARARAQRRGDPGVASPVARPRHDGGEIDRAAGILVQAVARLRAALPPGALERIA